MTRNFFLEIQTMTSMGDGVEILFPQLHPIVTVFPLVT